MPDVYSAGASPTRYTPRWNLPGSKPVITPRGTPHTKQPSYHEAVPDEEQTEIFVRLLLHFTQHSEVTGQAGLWLTSATNEFAGTHVIQINPIWHREGSEVPVSSPTPYPTAIMGEYRALVDRELHGQMTPEENARFADVRAQINAIDRTRSHPDTWDIQRAKLREELAQIRAEVEALPDAE